MDIFTIDGATPKVGVVSLQREASILDGDNAGRLKSGVMSRDVIGTFYNYTFEVMPNYGLAAYNDFYEIITAPVDSHRMEVVFGQGVLAFDAYIANATDNLLKATTENQWEKLSFSTVAMEPQRYFGEKWSIGSGSGNALLTIDGVNFDIGIKKIERKGAVLDSENSKRSNSGVMSREIIGTFYNYSMEIECKLYKNIEYDRLYYALTAPVNSHTIKVPYGSDTLEFDAYISGATDKLLIANDNGNFWTELKVDFTAMAPERT